MREQNFIIADKKTPKMILFDYGHTLSYEVDFDGVRGTEAIMKHATQNKNNLSADEINAFVDSIFNGVWQDARDSGVEVLNIVADRFIYEYLKISFDIQMDQVEKIFWDNAAPGFAMPNIGDALDYINNRGIRSGVISNISFCGQNLAKRINELLPENKFEFIIASSEYMYRKPNKMIFELALNKAELPAGEVWYCGDSTKYDVAGAVSAGIFPVWFHSEIECGYRDKNTDIRPECEHLYIRDWLELIRVLDDTR